jgi:hypothetical protein
VSDPVNNVPDPTRLRLLQSVFGPSSLVTVAEAIAVATEHGTQIYVERLSGGWRWSLVHRGGSYPLLRITARFLRVDYQKIMIGFRTRPGGFSVLCDDPKVVQHPEVAAIMVFGPARPPAAIERRILDRFAG